VREKEERQPLSKAKWKGERKGKSYSTSLQGIGITGFDA